MRKPASGADLAIDILARSPCSVQVGAAIADKHGIFSWGWNSVGPDGFGLHAEAHAISRANRKRLRGALLFVASVRKRNGKVVTSKPCVECQRLIDKWNLRVMWRENNEDWIYEGR
jgi:deoxycytidylate deaminase